MVQCLHTSAAPTHCCSGLQKKPWERGMQSLGLRRWRWAHGGSCAMLLYRKTASVLAAGRGVPCCCNVILLFRIIENAKFPAHVDLFPELAYFLRNDIRLFQQDSGQHLSKMAGEVEFFGTLFLFFSGVSDTGRTSRECFIMKSWKSAAQK